MSGFDLSVKGMHQVSVNLSSGMFCRVVNVSCNFGLQLQTHGGAFSEGQSLGEPAVLHFDKMPTGKFDSNHLVEIPSEAHRRLPAQGKGWERSPSNSGSEGPRKSLRALPSLSLVWVAVGERASLPSFAHFGSRAHPPGTVSSRLVSQPACTCSESNSIRLVGRI